MATVRCRRKYDLSGLWWLPVGIAILAIALMLYPGIVRT